jgi:hypothetical protein
MKKAHVEYWGFYLMIFFFMNCVQPYVPPPIKGNNTYLVVDGFIRNGLDSTIIKLSRSANLGDSAGPQPELNAQVVIAGQISGTYPLINLGNGEYVTDQLNLDITQNYQLRIVASNGNQYLSDYVPVRQSPPIDSLHWQPDSVGVTIYVNTHDPQNNTRYYQWDYTETWEHRSVLFSNIEFVPDGSVIARPPADEINRCWTNANSTDILVASTAGLSQDLVNENPIHSIINGSEQISFLYSILVHEYAITQGAYEYWENLKKNTELTGTIFDPQPSEVLGNLHCITNPSEPVLGYVSICTPTTARIFIDRFQLDIWNFIPLSNCSFFVPSPDSLAYYATLPTLYQPLLYCPGVCYTALAFTECIDCRYEGGSNVKPLFWPN